MFERSGTNDEDLSVTIKRSKRSSSRSRTSTLHRGRGEAPYWREVHTLQVRKWEKYARAEIYVWRYPSREGWVSRSLEIRWQRFRCTGVDFSKKERFHQPTRREVSAVHFYKWSNNTKPEDTTKWSCKTEGWVSYPSWNHKERNERHSRSVGSSKKRERRIPIQVRRGTIWNRATRRDDLNHDSKTSASRTWERPVTDAYGHVSDETQAGGIRGTKEKGFPVFLSTKDWRPSQRKERS